MKKLLLGLLLLIFPLFDLGSAEGDQKKLRIALRVGDLGPLGETKSNPATLYGGGWQADDTLYGVWKIRGPERFQKKLIWYLQVLEKEHPMLYEVARRKVKMFRWLEGKSGSWAFAPHGNIGLAQWAFERKNGTHQVGLFFLTLIHEIQHCNTYGDAGEGAACYAMGFYGRKTKAVLPSRFLMKYYDALAKKKKYNALRWERNNLVPTRAAILR